MNYEVIGVTNWKEAMDVFKNKSIDFVFMDIMLPGKNGYQITSEIREYEKTSGKMTNVPIVALTANTLDNDKDKCLVAGMNDYISKPFTADDLYRVINKFIINR
jgi:CheY-like chemotaxis protein